MCYLAHKRDHGFLPADTCTCKCTPVYESNRPLLRYWLQFLRRLEKVSLFLVEDVLQAYEYVHPKLEWTATIPSSDAQSWFEKCWRIFYFCSRQYILVKFLPCSVEQWREMSPWFVTSYLFPYRTAHDQSIYWMILTVLQNKIRIICAPHATTCSWVGQICSIP